jgi:hypothetical protein
MMVRCGRIICLILLAVAPALPAPGDAIVVTRAMTATTIAEVFIDEDSTRVEFEIGLADLAAFPDWGAASAFLHRGLRDSGRGR